MPREKQVSTDAAFHSLQDDLQALLSAGGGVSTAAQPSMLARITGESEDAFTDLAAIPGTAGLPRTAGRRKTAGASHPSRAGSMGGMMGGGARAGSMGSLGSGFLPSLNPSAARDRHPLSAPTRASVVLDPDTPPHATGGVRRRQQSVIAPADLAFGAMDGKGTGVEEDTSRPGSAVDALRGVIMQSRHSVAELSTQLSTPARSRIGSDAHVSPDRTPQRSPSVLGSQTSPSVARSSLVMDLSASPVAAARVAMEERERERLALKEGLKLREEARAERRRHRESIKAAAEAAEHDAQVELQRQQREEAARAAEAAKEEAEREERTRQRDVPAYGAATPPPEEQGVVVPASGIVDVVPSPQKIPPTFSPAEEPEETEEDKIRREAAERRRARLEEEKRENEAREEALAARQRARHAVADTEWDEQHCRRELEAEEAAARLVVGTTLRTLTPAMLDVQHEERAARSAITAAAVEHCFALHTAVLFGAQEIARDDVDIEAADGFDVLREMTAEARIGGDVTRAEFLARSRVKAQYESGLEQHGAAFAAAAEEILGRELWRAVVDEVDARAAAEAEERTARELFMDGTRNSRTLVTRFGERVAKARAEWLCHVAEKLKDVVEQELAARVLMQREETLITRGLFGDAEREHTLLEAKERREREVAVQHAMRQAELFAAKRPAHTGVQYEQDAGREDKAGSTPNRSRRSSSRGAAATGRGTARGRGVQRGRK